MTSTDTTRYVYVGCGSAKRELDGHPNHSENQYVAADLYTSNYFKLKREYAERMGRTWSILSAKYGLIDPWALCPPYDVRLTASGFAGEDDALFDTIDEWGQSVMESIEAEITYAERSISEDTVDEIVVLAGKNYVNPIRDELEELGTEYDVDVRFPFDKTNGIGEQMGWLKENTDTSLSVRTRYAKLFHDEVEA